MRTIDEMLHLDLLTAQEHGAIHAWITRAKSPEAILAMPQPLWQALERASAVMNVDADLLRQPAWLAQG
ncbi:MAG: hypothetical protein HY856_00815 [Burkholderiales bacterium]|nr:hypothetical protein [Burkholderiales bacterium]